MTTPGSKKVEGCIIRAGFNSNAFCAGCANVDISGFFSFEDAEDVVLMLELTIRSIKRQVAAKKETL